MIERHLRRVNPQWSRLRVRDAAQKAFESYAALLGRELPSAVAVGA